MSSIVIPFIGGLAMFIYGMNIMADGLQHAAGSKMKKILEVLTQNKLMGIGCIGYGDYPKLLCHNGYGCRLCKRRADESDTGNQRYHGCEYRYNHHGLVGFRRRMGKNVQPLYTGTNRSYGRRNRNVGGEKAAKQGCSWYHHWVWYPFYRHEYHV